LRTYSRRVGDGDVEALALMLGLAEDIDAAIAAAVKGLRERGYSWAEIGSRLGITRQAAHQRWGWSRVVHAADCRNSLMTWASLTSRRGGPDGRPGQPA
jgi:hypothetical protein